MLDPRTGVVKIIDLGASRRFVHLSNKERNNRCAVEEQDSHALARNKPLTRLAPELCEGLGSLTGSPYYMAPEILLQANRYVDASGRARSVLEDYEYDYPSFLPREQWPMYQIGLSDLRRGWGIRADIWSWACTVQALLLKTVEEHERPSSSTISPYDFSFSRHREEMIDPLYEKSPGEDDVPRFHQWCRVLPLLIVRIALEPIELIPQADACSPTLRSALKASLRHQDLRPTADDIEEALRASRPSTARLSGSRATTPTTVNLRPTSSDRRRSQPRATSEASESPQMSGSELEGSRYATPSLSQGASSVSTPQHTCETASKSCREKTPDRDRRVRFETATADSAFFPGPSPESHQSDEVDHGASDPVPQGFEIVSPTRPPKIRSTTFGGAPRPATANATLQPFSASLKAARSTHVELPGAARSSRSHPSTPTSTVRDAIACRPGTSPRASGRDTSRALQSTEASQQVSKSTSISDGRNTSAELSARPRTGVHATSPCPSSSGTLGISWPLEGMRSLQLTSPTPSYRIQACNSVPSSPMAHSRGASMPLLGVAEAQGTSLCLSSPVALPSTRHPDGADIGGSPRCSVAGGAKSVPQSSLMATLKEKQVRLKQSSRKLICKRGSDLRSAQEAEPVYSDLQQMDMVQALNYTGVPPAQTGSIAYGHQHDSGMGTTVFTARSTAISSRRSQNRMGEEGSPSKPLLRRLLPWSTN